MERYIMETIKQCSFRCPESTWKQFKLLCLTKEVSCQDTLAELIEQYISKENGKESKRNIQSVSPL